MTTIVGTKSWYHNQVHNKFKVDVIYIFNFGAKTNTDDSGSPIPFFGPTFQIHQYHPVRNAEGRER